MSLTIDYYVLRPKCEPQCDILHFFLSVNAQSLNRPLTTVLIP